MTQSLCVKNKSHKFVDAKISNAPDAHVHVQYIVHVVLVSTCTTCTCICMK